MITWFMSLFHISERGDIPFFIPRKSKEKYGFRHYVWAIHVEKLHNYLFPRGCPRICVGGKHRNTVGSWAIDADPDARALVFIPRAWKEQYETCVLSKYQFEESHFAEIDAVAGYFVSERREVPVKVEEVQNCPQLHRTMNVKVSYQSTRELIEIRKEVLKSCDEFSIIQWDNLI